MTTEGTAIDRDEATAGLGDGKPIEQGIRVGEALLPEMDEMIAAGRIRETTQDGAEYRTFEPVERELSQAESDAAILEAFAQAQRTIPATTPGDRLRAIADGSEMPGDDEALLVRLAELLDQDRCLAKLAQEPLYHSEPLFTLRGRDALAADCVRKWAARAEGRKVAPEKVADARRIADAMDAWPVKHLPGEPLPALQG